jgi:hypothetical protein
LALHFLMRRREDGISSYSPPLIVGTASRVAFSPGID